MDSQVHGCYETDSCSLLTYVVRKGQNVFMDDPCELNLIDYSWTFQKLAVVVSSNFVLMSAMLKNVFDRELNLIHREENQ